MNKKAFLSELPELEDLEAQDVFPIEYLRMFIAAEQEHGVRVGQPAFECYVIEFPELKRFLERLCERPVDTVHHFQLIVKNEAHYATVGILWGPNQEDRKACLLEVSNDLKGFRVGFFLDNTKLFSKVFVVSGSRKTGLNSRGSSNLQNDNHSCFMFAFDHAIQLSQKSVFPHLESLLKASDSHRPPSSLASFTWEQMPISMVRHAQSLKLIEQHARENHKDLASDYPIIIGVNKQAGKFINISISHLFEEKRQQTLFWLIKADEKIIQRVIANPVTAASLRKRPKQWISGLERQLWSCRSF